MKVYEMMVQTGGSATVLAATKKEAREKADRGEFHTVRLWPVSPLISTIRERS